MNRPGVFPALDTWMVAFVDYGRNLWWHRFTNRGFRHVFAFAYDTTTGTWIVFDPTLEGFIVRPLPRSAVDAMIADLMLRDAVILKCKAEGKSPRRPRLFATCVTVVSHLLGLPGCAVRPYGLYRMLLKRGAVPAFERQHEGSVRRREESCPRR
jgi:hypothetical protein